MTTTSGMFFGEEKSQKLAVILALVGSITPIAGFHKFYLGQYRWGLVYLFISMILMPPPLNDFWILSYFGVAQVASGFEAIWYFLQSETEFQGRFSGESPSNPQLVAETTEAIRKLDQLRADGLLSEYEFEQQRRQLMAKLSK
ncbi:MAG: SHOCT domain-containing protein [Halothece sp.]